MNRGEIPNTCGKCGELYTTIRWNNGWHVYHATAVAGAPKVRVCTISRRQAHLMLEGKP